MTLPQGLRQEVSDSIASHAERWRHCEGIPESTLLRLSILRGIIRELHAKKSSCLASGRRDLSKEIHQWESRIEELRSETRLEGELSDLVNQTRPIRKRTRVLPDAVFSAIEGEKFERFDRQWELAIAAEAAHLGWHFWALESWVEIAHVEEWNNKLSEQLWPAGIVLFVESSSVQGPSGVAVGGQHFPLWRGRWLTAIHPRFKSPQEIALNFSQWPGSPPTPPSAHQWKLLFSPKIR